MEDSTFKACTKCGVEKPATSEFFCADRSKRDGLSYCKACKSAFNRTWYQITSEERPEQIQQRRERNSGQQAVYSLAWRKANPDRQKHYAKAWRVKNPEKVAASNRNRKARLKNACGRHAGEDILRQLSSQGGCCYWCGTILSTKAENKYHADHLIPLAKGGSNGPENIVCACPSCNLSKHAKMPWEFAGRLL